MFIRLLRWLLVLPGSLASAAAAYWVSMSFSARYLGGTLAAIAFASLAKGAIFVYVGMRIAPTHKRQTGWALALIFLIVPLMLLPFVNPSALGKYNFKSWIDEFCTLIGAVVAATKRWGWLLPEEENKPSPPTTTSTDLDSL